MADKILEKLNELDAGSVTPQEFQKVWGISKEEYLSRMMDYVHKRKARAAEEAAHEEREDRDEVDGLKEQLAALKKEVEQLKLDVKALKAILNDETSLPSTPSIDYLKKFMASRSLGKKDRQSPFDDEHGMLFRMMSQGESYVISPLHMSERYGEFIAPGVFTPSNAEEETMGGAIEGHRPRRRRK